MFSWIRTGASAVRRRGVLAVVLQDGGDRGVGAGAEHQRAGAGGIDPLGAVALDQAEDADAGAEALLGMRPRAQDDIDQHWRRRGRPLAASRRMRSWRPVAIAPVGAGHVLGRRWSADAGAALRRWLATRLPRWKISTVRGGDPRLDLLAEQLVRHAVVVLGDLDMVVEADPAALPLGVFVGLGRQRPERRPVELLEQRPPAACPSRASADRSARRAARGSRH